jgi:hypothetical protein
MRHLRRRNSRNVPTYCHVDLEANEKRFMYSLFTNQRNAPNFHFYYLHINPYISTHRNTGHTQHKKQDKITS